MLRIESLHAHYGLSHVLQGVDLQVGANEVVGLFGRNGVGKTTVLKTVAGWVPPTSGAIRLGGVEIGGKPSDVICRLGLGLVPEDRRIFPGFSVEENLKLGFLQVPRRPRAESKVALQRAYDLFPRLWERRRQEGVTLSGGEQQMLAIARVLVGAPRLLLIDEPTEGLAPFVVDELFEIVVRLRKEGIPILLVEQKVFRALDVCTRFYALERGRVVVEGDAASPSDRDMLRAAIAI
jgi:branched-chain amino acid transport system ATP-binding protein